MEVFQWTQLENIQALLFDFDGTLVESMSKHYLTWMEASRQLDFDFDLDAFLAYAGMPLLEICADVLRKGKSLQTSEMTPDGLKDRLHQIYATLDRKVRRIEVVYSIAQKAQQLGIPCGIVTSSSRVELDAAIKEAHLDLGLFQEVVTVDEIPEGLTKPHPYPFLHCAEKLGASIKKCVGFEDGCHGLESLQRAEVLQSVDVRQLDGYEDWVSEMRAT